MSLYFTSLFTVTLDQQKRIFLPAPSGIRKCVVSTNIAATSLTIEGVRYWFLSVIKSCDRGNNSERSGFGKPLFFSAHIAFFWVCSKKTIDIIINLEVTSIFEPNLKSTLLNNQGLGRINVGVFLLNPCVSYLLSPCFLPLWVVFVRYVVDSGFVKQLNHNPRVGLDILEVVPISK